MMLGIRREQLDRDAERAAQKTRGKFCQEQRDAEADRNADQQCDGGSDERAEHGDQRAKFVVDRIPIGTGQKSEAECVNGGHAAMDE